jgi:Rad3-related DNA helicase
VTELQQYLDIAGFGARKAQLDLYEHLIKADRRGVIAQAGTGTGKSAAILAAAANRARATGKQSLVVTPTLTLMNQYRDGDVPRAATAYDDLWISELRGRAHYHCDIAAGNAKVMGIEYIVGCEGSDGGCTVGAWSEEGSRGLEDPVYRCDYQHAKMVARTADIVVTNADMLIVNDRILAPLDQEIFDLEGSLFVDEAHTLEQKLRDWASRSLWWKSLERFHFAGTAGPRLATWLKERAPEGQAMRDLPSGEMANLRKIAYADMPTPHAGDGLSKMRETQEACMKILAYLEDTHDNLVLHVNDGSLKMDWINISRSAGELLTARDFGLVSATIPKTMAATLGVEGAPFIDVGHPFDYANQAWLGFSAYGGDYKAAQHDSNFIQRCSEVYDLIVRAKGGALVLFSSFRDLERVREKVGRDLENVYDLRVLAQERDMEAADRQALADEFKADGNAVLFGSESFATGFDVPGDALRLVVIWKLPYPAVNPVSNAIRASSFARYDDLMKVRAVQGIGRLIRTEADKGIVWIADSRGQRLLNASDPLTSHLPTFARL